MRFSLASATSSGNTPFVTVPSLPHSGFREGGLRGVVMNERRRGTLNVRPLVMWNSKQASSSTAVMSMTTGTSKVQGIPIMVNGCSGKMGQAVIKSAVSAGLNVLPVSFGSSNKSGSVVEVCDKEIQIYGPSEREAVLTSLYDQHPDLIVVDYTVPSAVNDNADLYCKIGVPFVMGTTGGDRDRLMKTVEESKVYAVISPQMAKKVVGFLAMMEMMAEQFPGLYTGYSLQVMESHQASKVDTSGTAKAVISSFQKMGINFDMNEIKMIRDRKRQLEMVGVPEEYLDAHAFHMYLIMSPDESECYEFQHNVCGRSCYADGTVDAVIFLAKKVGEKSHKRLFNMIDILREGHMR